MSQLQVELSADWTKNTDDSQWLGNFTDASSVTHFAFAHLEQETRSLGVRLSYTATPTLSFQLYAAPFVSRGAYTNTRELSATPRAERYEDRYSPYTPPAGTLARLRRLAGPFQQRDAMGVPAGFHPVRRVDARARRL